MMRWHRRHTAWTIGICLLLVLFWEVMNIHARRGHPPFTVTSSDFDGFTPVLPAYVTERLPIGDDPLQPNVLVIRARSMEVSGESVQFRLVHGYNMRDCMRLKGYEVHLLDDARTVAADHALLPVQVWLLVSPSGARSVWLTTMLRTDGLTPTARDMRSVPFPRIGVPLDAGWAPTGFRWSSLRHPWRNARLFLRARWNNARCDPLVFAGLKRPPWADPATFTYVSLAAVPPGEVDHQNALARVSALHGVFLVQLRAWYASRDEAASE